MAGCGAQLRRTRTGGDARGSPRRGLSPSASAPATATRGTTPAAQHTSRQLDTATTIAGCIPSPDYDIMQLASFDMDRVKGAELYIQDPPRGATASTPHAVRERSTNAQPCNT